MFELSSNAKFVDKVPSEKGPFSPRSTVTRVVRVGYLQAWTRATYLDACLL
jgi:hypothetical protein